MTQSSAPAPEDDNRFRDVQHQSKNRRVILLRRPSGAPVTADFRLEAVPLPEVQSGQVLLRTLYLSLDPYMRSRMDSGPSYAPAVGLGEVMPGGTVSVVEVSRNPKYRVGDRVLGYTGWQEYALSDGSQLRPIPATLEQPSLMLGVLGMPGFTGTMGLLEIGAPKRGETLVVSAATGAVGSVVGQVGKLKECRVIGIAGGPTKCRYAVEELGFDACVDHREPDLPGRLAAVCPNGIDVYFENVGGAVFDAVLPLLKPGARVPVCGVISQYNDSTPPPGPDRLHDLLRTMVVKRIRMQGFVIFQDFGHRFGEFIGMMTEWVE
ncbi:MAG TPA: NADP-dependent oxidoreductase, partial [Polyangiaceae bacterium]|nr:NADP-dependent oxidoreductase [Polyangiaceae bacterium]